MQPSKKLNALLWTVQILLAALFLFAGWVKLTMPAATLSHMSPFPVAFLRFIAVAEISGALGLILPWAFRIHPELTPLAASGLVIIMAGATVSTVAVAPVSGALLPAVVGVLATLVARRRLAETIRTRR